MASPLQPSKEQITSGEVTQTVSISPNSTESSKARNQSIDALKGFGIIAVIFLHLPQIAENPDNIVLQILSVIARFAIPCFFMISGYFFRLSWEKREDKFQLLLDRYIRIVPIFLFWALFYAIVPPHIGAGTWEHLRGIVLYPHSFILTGGVYHLWFLSSLLQGLTILWLALRFKAMPAALILGALLFIVAVVSETYAKTHGDYAIGFDPKNGPFFSTLFLLLGALVKKNSYISTNKILSIACIAFGIFLSFFEAILTSRKSPIIFHDSNMTIGLVPYSFGIISIFLNKEKNLRPVCAIGKYSLGIYLLHPWILETIKLFDIFSSEINTITMLILTLLLSFLGTHTLGRIPPILRLIS